MFCGFTIGSALDGVVASQIVADHGWRSVLVVGGVLPLLLAPVLWWALPESVRYLVMKGGDPRKIVAALHRIAPQADLET
jgi:AAHS family 4-hydroxybenzoate transporter-like MFS transporter